MKPILIIIIIAHFLCMPSVSAKSLDKVTVQLSWKHQFQFAGFYAAIEQGFYKAAGLEVTLLEGGPKIVCNEALLSSTAQYCTAPGSIVQRRIDGEKIVALASIIQYSPIVLLTRKDSGLKTVHDLIGKRVESMLVGKPHVMIQAMFEGQGIDLSQLDNRENSFGVDVLVNKEVDAQYGYISNEPHLLELAGIEYNVIKPIDYGIDFYGDVIVTSEKELQWFEDRAKRFRAATIKGWYYALAHKEALVDHIIQHYDSTKNKESLLAEAYALEKLMLPNLIQIGQNNEERWQSTAASLASIGLIKKDYSLKGFIYETNRKDGTLWYFVFVGGVLLLLIYRLLCSNRRLASEVKRQVLGRKSLEDAQEVAIKKAYTDELSGMGNRRACYEYGDKAVEYTKEHGEPLSIVMIDIDHFKQINDQFGHPVGDEVICSIAKLIMGRIRETDIQGRVGGEEFAIILPNTDTQGAHSLAEEIRAAFESTEVVIDDLTIKVTASFGIAAFKTAKDDVRTIMKRADKALYRAKEAGRNIVVTD